MAEKNIVIFGDFTDTNDGEIRGRLALSFQSQTLNLDELWESSSLSAKFLSTFWGKFFPKSDPESGRIRKDVEDEILYISGELLGNAVKFSFEPSFLAEICLYLHESELRFYVTNSINPNNIEQFQNFIKRVLSEDASELFLEQMEKSVAEESHDSGVGFLTLMNDYGVSLAWKFEEKLSGLNTVTTLARLPIVRKGGTE